MTIRILFAGTPDVAVPSLKTLAQDEEFEVVAVVTRPDAVRGRGRKTTPSPVKAAATELGIPVVDMSPREEQFISTIQSYRPDMAAVVAYGNILRPNVLESVPLGWYNLHFSLLPQWRGAAPAQRALWAGQSETGVSIFRITEGMDEGPVANTMTTSIQSTENSGELLARLAQESTEVFVETLRAVAHGTASLAEQPQEGVTFAEKITLDDAHIQYSQAAKDVDLQIRACNPDPGAWMLLYPQGVVDDESDPIRLRVDRATPATVSDIPEHYMPSKPLQAGMLIVGKKNVWIMTEDQPLELLNVTPQGKKTMRAADWARGARLTEKAVIA